MASKLDFQGPGLKVKVTVAIFRKTCSLAPTFIDEFKYNFTQMLGMTISRASSSLRGLGSRSRSLASFRKTL